MIAHARHPIWLPHSALPRVADGAWRLLGRLHPNWHMPAAAALALACAGASATLVLPPRSVTPARVAPAAGGGIGSGAVPDGDKQGWGQTSGLGLSAGSLPSDPASRALRTLGTSAASPGQALVPEQVRGSRPGLPLGTGLVEAGPVPEPPFLPLIVVLALALAVMLRVRGWGA